MDIRNAFPSKYLKASDLGGKAVAVVIDRVEFEAVGQTKDMKPVLYFQGKEKGMVLNKTCCNKIIELNGSPVTEDWPGQNIVIYPTETSFQGEQVECIRIRAAQPQRQSRPAQPPPPPQPEPDHGDINDSDIPF